MLLENISNKELLINTKKLVKKEGEIISQVINHLEEIEVRKLYSDLKYKSIYDYCTDELGYSKDQAYRRISAMRLTRKLPETKEKLATGKINLSSANMLSTLIKDGNLNTKEQRMALTQIEGKTKNETNKIISCIRENKGLPATQEKIKISISQETMNKIKKVQGLNGNKDLDEILELMADSMIEKYEENLKPKKVSSGTKNMKSRYIRKSVKLAAYQKSKGKCEICGSIHKLQYDHKIPFARSGTNIKSNIRLLCQNCNLRQGILQFGTEIMQRRVTNTKNEN